MTKPLVLGVIDAFKAKRSDPEGAHDAWVDAYIGLCRDYGVPWGDVHNLPDLLTDVLDALVPQADEGADLIPEMREGLGVGELVGILRDHKFATVEDKHFCAYAAHYGLTNHEDRRKIVNALVARLRRADEKEIAADTSIRRGVSDLIASIHRDAKSAP